MYFIIKNELEFYLIESTLLKKLNKHPQSS